MDLAHRVQRTGVDRGERIPLLVGCGHLHVIDVERQAAAGSPDQFGDEINLRPGARGKGEIGGGVLQQDLAAERLLHLIDMGGDAGEALTRIGQQVVEETDIGLDQARCSEKANGP